MDPAPAHAPALLRPLLVFTALRLGLVVLLTVVLQFFVPLIIGLTLAIVLQLPLAMLLFGRQRSALNDALAARNAGRRDERARLRADLRGEGLR